jgi:2'-5' RNA ligase
MASDADDAIASTFDSAWASFQTLGSLVLVEDTLEGQWARGRAQYLTFLARVEDGAACDYVAGVQERLAGIPGVDLYPGWYWHITIKGAGFQVIKRTFPDDVLRQDVPRIDAAARKLLAREPAFEARLGPPSAFAEVVVLEVHDGGRVRALNQRLCQELPDIARYPVDGATFLPHVSIARFTSSDGLAQLKEALASLRAEPPGPTLAMRRIEFVKVWLTEDMPEFQTLATYSLAAPR